RALAGGRAARRPLPRAAAVLLPRARALAGRRSRPAERRERVRAPGGPPPLREPRAPRGGGLLVRAHLPPEGPAARARVAGAPAQRVRAPRDQGQPPLRPGALPLRPAGLRPGRARALRRARAGPRARG